MIDDSHEWKETIKRNNRYVLSHVTVAAHDTSDTVLSRIHIRLLCNALFIRRLLETSTVATSLRGRKIPASTLPWSGTSVDYLNVNKLDQHYLLQSATTGSVTGVHLCNQIIHSFVWAWITSDVDGSLRGFIVSSDRRKHAEALAVEITSFVSYAHCVATSWPTSCHYARDKQSGQWRFEAT